MIKLASKLLVLSAFLMVCGSANAVIVDGIIDAGEYDYVGEDHIPYGSHVYDVEFIGLTLDGGNLYFGLQTGFDVSPGSGVPGGNSGRLTGDLVFDLNGDGSYETVLTWGAIAPGPVQFDMLAGGTEWLLVNTDFYTPDSNPLAHDPTDAGWVSVGSVPGAFGTTTSVAQEESYILEGCIALPTSFQDSTSDFDGGIAFHWTMGCGNDYGDVTTTPVPEPASIAMLGAGLLGVFAGRRKLRRK